MNDTTGMSYAQSTIIVGTTLSVAIILGVTPLFCGIILYEKFGSSKHRTLINLVVSSICWNFIGWNIFVQGTTVVRFVCGPLSGELDINLMLCALASNLISRVTAEHLTQRIKEVIDCFDHPRADPIKIMA